MNDDRFERGHQMSDQDSGPEAGIKGVVEDVKGKAKAAADEARERAEQ